MIEILLMQNMGMYQGGSRRNIVAKILLFYYIINIR